jgi:hypothetical protein
MGCRWVCIHIGHDRGAMLVEGPTKLREPIRLREGQGVNEKTSRQPAGETALRCRQLPGDERERDHEELKSESAAGPATDHVPGAGKNNSNRQHGVGMQWAFHSGGFHGGDIKRFHGCHMERCRYLDHRIQQRLHKPNIRPDIREPGLTQHQILRAFRLP